MVFERIARRFAGSLVVLLLASLVAFVILTYTPGDAAQRMIGESASVEELAALRSQLGIDQPLLLRYLRYLGAAASGDLGRSLINNRPVADMIGERFTNTLIMALAATLVSSTIGILIGAVAAVRHGSWADLAAMSLSALGISLPNFGLAMLLTLVFSLHLRLLPVAGGGTLKHMVLPVVTLSLPMTAVIARLSRSSLLDSAQSLYVLSARARGLAPLRVWGKHILKNALVPVVTIVGLNFGHLLGGAFVVETIYGYPGLGRMVVQAVFDKDYPIILGAVLLMAVIFQLFNLAVDVAHGLLDPRVGSEAV